MAKTANLSYPPLNGKKEAKEICPKCGIKFSTDYPKCPNCGAKKFRGGK